VVDNMKSNYIYLLPECFFIVYFIFSCLSEFISLFSHCFALLQAYRAQVATVKGRLRRLSLSLSVVVCWLSLRVFSDGCCRFGIR